MRTRPLTDVSPRELRPLLDEESDHWAGELLWDYRDVSHAVASGLERRVAHRAGCCRTARARSRTATTCSTAAARSWARCSRRPASAARASRRRCSTRCWRTPSRHPRQRPRGVPDALLDRGRARTAASPAPASTAAGGTTWCVTLRQPVAVPEPSAWTLRPLRRDDLTPAARIIHRSHQGSLDAALNLTYATPGLLPRRSWRRWSCARAAAASTRTPRSWPTGPDGGGRRPAGQPPLAHERARLPGLGGAGGAGPRPGRRCSCRAPCAPFRAQGLSTASLSVTVENRRAYRLYERLGFRLRKEFAAHAWVRPPARIEMPACVTAVSPLPSCAPGRRAGATAARSLVVPPPEPRPCRRRGHRVDRRGRRRSAAAVAGRRRACPPSSAPTGSARRTPWRSHTACPSRRATSVRVAEAMGATRRGHRAPTRVAGHGPHAVPAPPRPGARDAQRAVRHRADRSRRWPT